MSALPTAAVLAAAALALAAACSEARPPDVSTGIELADLLGGADTLHARAVEPREFRFPDDHGPHPGFRTEWWYFTGNVTTDGGREMAYHLTFFRSALTDSATFVGIESEPGTRGPGEAERSPWRTRHAYMAHFAVTDIQAGRFHAAQRFARGAAGLAGAAAAPFRVWLHGWEASSLAPAATFPVRLRATDGEVAIDLRLEAGKPPVLQGDRGLSRKGPEPGNASYYYSLTRMPTAGTIRIAGREHRVTGTSWLDREWSTSVLSPDVEGWDWMSLQFDDGTELMVYRLRRADGTASPFSAATLVDAAGAATHLDARDFTMTPLRRWRSPAGGREYPVRWRVQVPRAGMDLDVEAALDAQELDLAVRYWEGSVRVRGTRRGQPLTGRGFLEMT